MKHRPSMRDVAEHAGVSVGTVSHALNHPDRLAPETLAKVESAIAAIGFVRSGSARQLREGTSRAVGVVVLDVGNPFYTEAARGIEDHVVADGLVMLLSSSDGDRRREAQVLQLFEEEQVRGIIVTPSAYTLELAAPLHQRGMRIVLLDHAPHERYFSVASDDVAGGRMAVAHLLELGHRRIGLLNGLPDLPQVERRWEGARQAVREAGLEPERILVAIQALGFDADGGAAAMTELLARENVPTATFCTNDVMAMGAMRVLRQRGLRVPQDMALVGYDDIPVSAELATPLTSVSQSMRRLGDAAAGLVLDTGPVRHVSFTPELVVRASTVGG